MKKPFPAPGQSMKAEKLESRVFVPLFVAILLFALGFLAYACYKFDQNMQYNSQYHIEDHSSKELDREIERIRLEDKAIQEHHAVEVQP